MIDVDTFLIYCRRNGSKIKHVYCMQINNKDKEGLLFYIMPLKCETYSKHKYKLNILLYKLNILLAC